MGLCNRMELESKVPYVHASSDTVSREIFTGTAVDKAFHSSGHGLGDVEATLRYQLNRGGPDKPFYVGWLRYKSRTGKDPFEVVTDCVTRCVANATGTGLPLELPTGSGFQAIQPGLTWLYASDPVVFFGSFSYLHNFKREDVRSEEHPSVLQSLIRISYAVFCLKKKNHNPCWYLLCDQLT